MTGQVDVSWHDRQFHLPGHVAHQISRGATRNLLLHNVNPKVTEDQIREDLDHIHNLVVIEVKFLDGLVQISLNSVHNALYARTCMRSRQTYKNSKIDFFADSCAQALPVAQRATPKQVAKVAKLETKAMANRFQMLSIDSLDKESTISEDDALRTTSGNASTWRTAAVAV